MGLKTPRWLVVAGVASVLVMSSVSASASTPSARFDPAAATSACAQGRAPTSALGPSDVRFLAEFIPCVLRYYRSHSGLRYVQSRQLSRLTADALARLVKLPYLAEHNVKPEDGAIADAGGAIASAFCHSHGSSHPRFRIAVGDTSGPPPPTPLLSATALAQLVFRNRDGIARDPAAVFGVAAQRGLLFRRNDLAGAATAIVVAICT